MAKFKIETYRYWPGEQFEVLDGGKVHDIVQVTDYNDDIGRHAPCYDVTFLTPVADGEEESIYLTPYVMEDDEQGDS